jgi:AcrR family transcriptional regulator
MNRFSTRERLVSAATSLFAEHGFRGASVRDICNLAGANPGAVSYHFGGKRQLYRTVLRQAVETLASQAADVDREPESTLIRILDLTEANPAAARLLLRDLADGGTTATEALVPTLRNAYAGLRSHMEMEDDTGGKRAAQHELLRLAAPLFLLTAAWPVLEHALDLDPNERRDLLEQLTSPGR